MGGRQNCGLKQTKLFGAFVILVLLSLFGQATAAINCRKFVFAPACRGVTSKRSYGPGVGGAPKFDLSAESPVSLSHQTSSNNLEDDGGDSQQQELSRKITETGNGLEP